MSRTHSFTVVLEETLREEDAKPVLEALAMVKGVQSVQQNEASASADFVAEGRAMSLWVNLFYSFMHSAVRADKRKKLKKLLEELENE